MNFCRNQTDSILLSLFVSYLLGTFFRVEFSQYPCELCYDYFAGLTSPGDLGQGYEKILGYFVPTSWTFAYGRKRRLYLGYTDM
jgi:hypothetical protein